MFLDSKTFSERPFLSILFEKGWFYAILLCVLIFTQTIKPLMLCATFGAYRRNFGSSLTYDDVTNSFTDTWHIWRHKWLVYMVRNISAKFHAIGLLFPDIWRGGTFLPPVSNEGTKDPITNRDKYFLLLGLIIAVWVFGSWLHNLVRTTGNHFNGMTSFKLTSNIHICFYI